MYENNYSIDRRIKEAITKELGVNSMMVDASLVSAQTRKREYWFNWDCPQPEDKQIYLADILDSGIVDKEKSYCLKHQAGNARDYIKKHHTQVAFEPVAIGYRGRQDDGNWVKRYEANPSGKANALTTARTDSMVAEPVPIDIEGKDVVEQFGGNLVIDGKLIHKVTDGLIPHKDKMYPINLPDGYYIVRKLTVDECKRLQCVPEDFVFPVSDSQAYKMLGNGWCCDVISHLLSFAPHILDEHIEVISMYDGMSCGMIALNKIQANVVSYKAFEIDKYCIQTSQSNFKNIIQCGDAFQVRDWS